MTLFIGDYFILFCAFINNAIIFNFDPKLSRDNLISTYFDSRSLYSDFRKSMPTL